MWTLDFWREAAERAIKSAAQAPLVAWGVGELAAPDAFTLDWRLGLGVAAGGALVSVLTSLVSARVGDRRSPSLIARR